MITIKSDIDRLSKTVKGFGDQIPFATATALTRLAVGARLSTGDRIKRDINKPKPFTVKAARYRPANKRNLTSKVFLTPKTFAYLDHLISGGTVKPKRSKIAIGVNARRNQYGNTPRKGISTALSKENTFIGTIKGIHGVWQRYKGKSAKRVKLLYAFHSVTKYQANQFKYYANVQKFVSKNFSSEFTKSFHESLRSARWT